MSVFLELWQNSWCKNIFIFHIEIDKCTRFTLSHKKCQTADKNICLQNFKNCFVPAVQRLRANSVDPDEAAHPELPHLDLYCLRI